MSYLERAKRTLAARSPDAPDACVKCGTDATYYTPAGKPLCDSHAPKPTDGPLVRFAVDAMGLTITGRSPTMRTEPEPGSAKAVAQGCTCEPLKWVDGKAAILIRLSCPVHVKPSRKEKS